MIVGVVKETFPGERRVAVVPAQVSALAKADLEVLVQEGAGDRAGIKDADYREKGARLASSRAEVFGAADVLLQVRLAGGNPLAGAADLDLYRKGQLAIGQADPLSEPEAIAAFAATGATLFSLELVPRITRAQSMDVLSSMAMLAGYRAVLLAATALNKMFPMMMTAAGTIAPARVFVVGAGVAGLQAIATARRMGAVVKAYDVRPAVREQVESLGAKFVDLPLEVEEGQDTTGYAREFDEAFYRRQREMMMSVVGESDVVITTAAVPGKTAPKLINAEMVARMPAGSVLVDLAAERGGNCELTRPGETVESGGVQILGPLNVPTDLARDASQLYAKNIATFLMNLTSEGQIKIDLEDEITRDTLVARDGKIINQRVSQLLDPKPDPSDDDAKGN